MTKVGFFICVQMGRAVVSCAIPSTMNRQMRAEIVWVTTVKKLINQSGCFKNTLKFNWSFLIIGLAREYLL